MGDKKFKDFIIVTEKGVMSGEKDPSKILAMLMYAYLNVWNNDIGEIDVMKAGSKIVELLDEMMNEDDDEDEGEELTFLDVLNRLLVDDEDGEA